MTRLLLTALLLVGAACSSTPNCPEGEDAESPTSIPVEFIEVPGKNEKRVVAYVRTNEDFFDEYETCRPWLTLADDLVEGEEVQAGAIIGRIFWNAGGREETLIRAPWTKGTYVIANKRVPEGQFIQSYELARKPHELLRLRDP